MRDEYVRGTAHVGGVYGDKASRGGAVNISEGGGWGQNYQAGGLEEAREELMDVVKEDMKLDGVREEDAEEEGETEAAFSRHFFLLWYLGFG